MIIRGNSLEPILKHGQYIDIKYDNIFPILNGEIIIFNDPSPKIKICIGTPGNFISISENYLVINKTIKAPVPFINEAQIICWASWIESTQGIIPENCYIVMGLSLESIDSRSRGFISSDVIKGKAILWQEKKRQSPKN
jgi:signal peptidase I